MRVFVVLVLLVLLCSCFALSVLPLSSPYVSVWLQNKRFSSLDSTLTLVRVSAARGHDALGSFFGSTSLWQLPNATEGLLETSTLQYTKNTNVLRFRQRFVSSVHFGNTQLRSALATEWPAFERLSVDPSTLFAFTYQQNFGYPRISKWTDAVSYAPLGGQPTVLYNASLHTWIISPVSLFQVSGQGPTKKGGGFSSGLLSSVTSVAANTVFDVIAVSGVGINNTFAEFGRVFRALVGAAEKVSDPIQGGGSDSEQTSVLTYATDHGGYLWYNCKDGCTNTLSSFGSHFAKENIPCRAIQIDSWWYQKGQNGFNSGGSGSYGTYSWTPASGIFPTGLADGLRQFAKHLKHFDGSILHNRWFCPANAYDGKWPFYTEKEMALPTSDKFYSHIIENLNLTGFVVYEQDWIITQWQHIHGLQASVSLGHDWFQRMNAGVIAAKSSMQLCMPLPMHYLEGAAQPAATTIRVSDDYLPQLDWQQTQQWRIGYNTLLATALGYRSFKDNFWSSDGKQPGCPYDVCENYNAELQTLIAVISRGPVWFSDGLNFANATRLRRTCNSDGLILQPSIAAHVVDGAFLDISSSLPPPGQIYQQLTEVWASFTQIQQRRFYFVLAINLTSDFVLDIRRDLDAQDGSSMRILDYESRALLGTVSPNAPRFTISKNAAYGRVIPFRYFVISPTLKSGFILLGELDKFIPVSTVRFSDLDDRADGFDVRVSASATEFVVVSIIDKTGKQIQTTCKGTSVVSCNGNKNACTCKNSASK